MEIEEIDAGGPPWNPKHDGIPVAWKHKGDGGNAHVWADGNYAIKRLRPKASSEPVKRFAREARLLAEMAGDPKLAVVPIIEVRKRAGEIEIVMELLEGNLAEVIGDFAGQPHKAAAALIPIVETLALLAARSQPIYHRDIKPENLLYRRCDGRIELLLGSGLVDQSQKITVAASAMAEKKTVGQRS